MKVRETIGFLFILIGFSTVSAECAFGETAPEMGLQIVVTPISYLTATDRLHILRYQTVREAIIFCLRRAGTSVASEGGILEAKADFEYLPPERFRAAFPDKMLIRLTADDSQLEIAVEEPGADTVFKDRYSMDSADVLPTTQRILSLLSKKHNLKALQWPNSSSSVSTAAFADPGRLDWTLVVRLQRICSLLAQIDDDKANLATYEQLAVLSALHASYCCRSDEIACCKWFAKAQVFAEIATQIAGQAEAAATAQEMRAEVGILAERFGAGVRSKMPSSSPLLAEVTVLFRIETEPLTARNEWPEVSNLFDFLVRCECPASLRGYIKTLERFAYRDEVPKLDVSLIWCKTRDSDSADFEASEFTVDQTSQYDTKPLLSLSLLNKAASTISAIKRAWNESPETLLQTQGLRAPSGKVIENRLNRAALFFLAIARGLEQAGAQSEFDQKVELSYLDVYPEIRNIFDQIARSIDTRLYNIAWGDVRSDLQTLIRLFSDSYDVAELHYHSPPAFRNDMILDWDRFLTFCSHRLHSPVESRTAWILTKLPSQVSSVIAAYHEGDVIAPSVQSQILKALNGLLDSKDLYSASLYNDVSPPESFQQELQSGLRNASGERLAEINLYLIRVAFFGLISPQDYVTPLPTQVDLELMASFTKAKDLFWSGQYARAANEMSNIAPKLMKGSGYWDLYYESFCRAGRVNEALATLANVQLNDRQADMTELTRFRALLENESDFVNLPTMLWEASTNSGADYMSRAEYAFRIADLIGMESVLNKYHYDPRPEFELLRALCGVTNFPQNPDAWKNLEDNLSSYLQQSFSQYWHAGPWNWVRYMDRWTTLLNEKNKTSRDWTDVRDRLHLVDWALLSESDRLLDLPLNDAALHELSNRLFAAVKERMASPQLSPLDQALCEWLFLVQAKALGLILKENLDNQTDQPQLNLDLVRSVVTMARAFYDRFPETRYTTIPNEAIFIYDALAWGADEEKVALWCASLPSDLSKLMFEHGSPFFSRFAKDAASLKALLQVSFIRPSSCSWLDNMYLYVSWDNRELYARLVAAGQFQNAATVAVRILSNNGDFLPLAKLLNSDAQANAWIERNAPTKTAKSAWSRDLKDCTKEPSKSLVEASSIPDLIENLKL